MSQEKRLLLFLVLSFSLLMGMQFVLERFGMFPAPPPPAPAKQAAAPPVAKKPDVAAKARDAGPAAAAEAPKAAANPPADRPDSVALVPPARLVLGALDERRTGFRLLAEFDQVGAGVSAITTPLHRAEIEPDGVKRRKNPHYPHLQLIASPEPAAGPQPPPSFALKWVDLRGPDDANQVGVQGEVRRLDNVPWEVVLDRRGRAVQPIADGGQQVTFRTRVGTPPVTITKTFRLRKGANGLELALGFESPGRPRKVAYCLLGPHGIPIEGEWYSGTFREVFIATNRDGATDIQTRTADAVASAEKKGAPERFLTMPLKYAGVENQYFAVFLQPDPSSTTPEKRWDAETVPVVVVPDGNEPQKSDVSVEMTSRPVALAAGPVEHTYRIFAGPKRKDDLAVYGAEELATYRKGMQIWVIGPAATALARYVISPLLDHIYAATATVSRTFGGRRGSYGIAIILLTVLVRLALFPLSRKQAISAKKMQDLQPLLTELRDKYKDDKEKFAREQWALFKRHGVNPLGGCLLAVIQLPIFIGLWQALNNSVALRHAPFLWIENLAAPDMLLRFPTDLPFLGRYFNALPFLVVGLMLVQMKLFSPPPTTPDQEMQQKVMKYMMVFMAFMFYKVPSGLGVYFITSSTWSICERLLLPKTIGHIKPPPAEEVDVKQPGPGPGGNGKGPGGKGKGPGGKPSGWLDELREKLDQIKEDAAQTRTHRNDPRGKGRPKPGRRG